MNEHKVRYYHAQAARLDLRRKWQSMAVWPIVYRFGDRLKMEFECQHDCFRMDLYIPALKLAIEIDEPHHDHQHIADADREKSICTGLGCEFLRLRVVPSEGRSLFQQVESACDEIQRRIDLVRPQEWILEPKRFHRVAPSREGGYSEAHLEQLREARIPELVEDMMRDLAALGFEFSDDIRPVTPGNAELGFSASISSMTFCVSVRSSGLAKLLVTQFSESAIQKLGITLDGPKKGSKLYWNINELQGRYATELILERLAAFQQALAHSPSV